MVRRSSGSWPAHRDALDTGTFAGIRFSRAEMREMRYAALLHDFGKVGVSEAVLKKAKKLYPGQFETLMMRFVTAITSAL